MVKRGYLTLEDGKLPGRERTAFQRAKEALIRAGLFASDGDNLGTKVSRPRQSQLGARYRVTYSAFIGTCNVTQVNAAAHFAL